MAVTAKTINLAFFAEAVKKTLENLAVQSFNPKLKTQNSKPLLVLFNPLTQNSKPKT